MTETELKNRLKTITQPDEAARKAAHAHWASLAKPLGGLGDLEPLLEDVAALTGVPQFDFSKRAVLVLCADNGVVAQGISQSGSDVTRAVLQNLAQRKTSVCEMAETVHCGVIPVDRGIAGATVDGVKNCRVRAGTDDFTGGPAMSREDALQAIETGSELFREQKAQGIKLLATGEMGIGNTTTSAAVSCVLLDLAPEEMTGRGAGLSNDGLRRKIEVIYKAIAMNHPEKTDVIGVLSALGGLDIAGLCGVFLGGALENIPVIIDGFISSVAALCAVRLCPTATKDDVRKPCFGGARGAYRFGSARQKAAHHGEYAPRRGHPARSQACRCGTWHSRSTITVIRSRRAASRRTPRNVDARHRRRSKRQKRLCRKPDLKVPAAALLRRHHAGVGMRSGQTRRKAPRHAEKKNSLKRSNHLSVLIKSKYQIANSFARRPRQPDRKRAVRSERCGVEIPQKPFCMALKYYINNANI